MTKKRNRAWILIAIVLIGAGTRTNHIHLQWGPWSTISSLPSTQAITNNADKLQNISGELLIFPWSYPKYAAILRQTPYSLQLQTYEFTEKKVKQLFQDLLQRHVNIHLMMENHPYQDYTHSYTTIQTTFSWTPGFQMQSDARLHTDYLHAKVTILDHEAFIQTANLTHSSLFINREYMFHTSDTGILQSLKHIFAKDRAGESLQLSDIHPNLLVCPINCRGVIEHLLASAKTSIIIQTQYINDPSIIDSLMNQKNKLPEIKILVANTTESTDMLAYMGNTARKESKEYLHAKMILIDNKILLLGSMNLSSESLDKNREVWILLTDPSLIRQFTWQFTKDWNWAKK